MTADPKQPTPPADLTEAEIVDRILAQTIAILKERKPGFVDAVLEYVADDQNDLEEDFISIATQAHTPLYNDLIAWIDSHFDPPAA